MIHLFRVQLPHSDTVWTGCTPGVLGRWHRGYYLLSPREEHLCFLVNTCQRQHNSAFIV